MAELTRPNLTGGGAVWSERSDPMARGADSRARRSRSARVWAGSKPIFSVPVSVPIAAVRTPWTDSIWWAIRWARDGSFSHDVVAHAEQAGLVASHLPGGQQVAMAVDRVLRLEQVVRDQGRGSRPLRGRPGSPDRRGQPLEQIGHAELARQVADLCRGSGPIDPHVLHFLDREDPVQEPGAEIGPARAEDLVVAKLEGLTVPPHPDRTRPRRRSVWLCVGRHAKLAARGEREETDSGRFRDGQAPGCQGAKGLSSPLSTHFSRVAAISLSSRSNTLKMERSLFRWRFTSSPK